MFFARTLLIAALMLSTASAATAQAARHFSSPREAIDAMVAAVAARDADAFAGLYGEDAIVLSPGQPLVNGRAAIRDSWMRNFANGYSTLSILQMRTEAGTDRAATLMIWEATVSPPGRDTQTFRGRSMIYAKREAEGWIISADMWQPAG